MKKNLQLKKILVGTVAAVALLSVSAIAEDRNTLAKKGYVSPVTQETQDKAKEDGIMPISINGEEGTAEKTEMKYRLVRGTIAEITKEEGYTRISIDNDDMGMVFTVENNVFVVDQKDGSYKSLEDLEKGMEITALLDNMSVMTMSIPPMTPGAIGFIMNEEGSNMDLSIYNKELTNKENTLKLNIDDKTIITDSRGARKVFTQEDIKESECLVLYGASTRSIPAQTTPYFVMIVNNKEMSSPKEEVNTPNQSTEPVLVSLREAAEKAGYTIKWISNDQPVLLEKEDIKIQISVGSNQYTLNGKQESLTLQTALQNSKIYISSELEAILK